MSIPALRYEVLRRDDGAIAVSLDTGQLSFAPSGCRVEAGSIAVLRGSDVGAWLRNVPADVIAAVASAGELLCFVFSTAGVAGEYRLACENLGMGQGIQQR